MLSRIYQNIPKKQIYLLQHYSCKASTNLVFDIFQLGFKTKIKVFEVGLPISDPHALCRRTCDEKKIFLQEKEETHCRDCRQRREIWSRSDSFSEEPACFSETFAILHHSAHRENYYQIRNLGENEKATICSRVWLKNKMSNYLSLLDFHSPRLL